MLILRFLWVDLQFKAILDACEEDGSPDRIPDLFERPPRKVVELYSLALAKLSNGDTKLAELAKKVFQWVVYSRRPLTIHELEEAISITTDQKSWAIPPFKLDLSKLCRMCGNLVKYDKANRAISLAHHTVLSFLLDCSDTPGISSLAFEESRAEQYLTDICLTYLSFVDFHISITRTLDTTSVRALNQPLRLASAILPNSIRPLASLSVKSSRFSSAAGRQVDMVNVLRSELGRHQSARPDPSFQLLEYCKAYWHKHSLYMELQDIKSLTNLESFIRGPHFPQEWKPWNFITDQKSLPYWNIFLWAVREGHAVIFHVWQNIVTMQEASYWNYLWLDKGQSLFASACTTANLEQLEIILRAKGKDKRVVRPSVDEISHELVRICHLGHSEVAERLLQERVDVNAAAAVGDGRRTALQAAAGGGHLAVVERLLQEKADVNAASRHNGRTALQAAAEGGHLAVVERLLQEKADVNAASRHSGRTALQAAAGGGHLPVIERLLQEKADVNAAARNSGRTALQAAAEGGHLAVVERLLQEKADVNAASRNNGRTALQAAAERGHLAVVERLLQEKADVNAASRHNGRTALQAAAEGGHLAVVERLRAAGAE
jgi:ankyrin repeat protein